MTLSNLLSQRAGEHKRKTFIKFEKRKVTYAEADNLVSFCAGGLKSLGLEDQGRVSILMDNCPEYIFSYFAVLRAGGVAVPVNTFLSPDEISYILNDSGCKILIYSDSFSSHVDKIKEAVPELRAFKFNDIPREQADPVKASENDLAVLLYTSGTTGFPKGAMLSHKNLCSNAEASGRAFDVSQRDKVLLFLPLFHSFTFTACVIVPIYAGATVVLLKSVKPFSQVIKSLVRDRITLFAGVPTIYNILSKKRLPAYMRYLLRFILNIRACISGAAALPEETLRAFEERFRVPLIEGYGLTEASPVVAVNPLRGPRKPASVGRPVPGVEAAVMGEDGKEMPGGTVGELAVRGPNVMRGYFNKKDETEKAIKDGWLYTGDLARIDEDGYIFIVDRKKDLIIIDGMNVYPREVEDIVMTHGSVEECAMVGIPDGRGSEVSVLFVKKKEKEAVDETEIRNLLKGRLAQFKIPRKVRFADELPKTATGKIKKVELRAWKF
jgi:long-chain acyl-CoA synthetase